MSFVDSSVQDEEMLLRTDFSPIHIRDGMLIAAAISTSDLSSRGFSIDRESLVSVDLIDRRAQRQMERMPEDRRHVWIACFQCLLIRQEILHLDNEPAFRVESDPIEENRAHALIYSYKSRTNSGMKALKHMLLPHLNKNLRTFEEYKARR